MQIAKMTICYLKKIKNLSNLSINTANGYFLSSDLIFYQFQVTSVILDSIWETKYVAGQNPCP